MATLSNQLRDAVIGSHRSVSDDHKLMRIAANEIERLTEALYSIANGDGYYGMQAREYKEIARAALARHERTAA